MPPPGYLAVSPRAGEPLTLRSAPAGRVIARESQSMFGRKVVAGVVRRSGSWLAVTSEFVANGHVGWVDARRVVVTRVRDSIDVSLSRRLLELRRDGRVVRRVRVGIGAADSPTPTGRFAVSEKLPGPSIGSVYGCCILGLTAHQPHPPAGWSSGTAYYVAIHGGSGIGTQVSAGCLHAGEADLRYLMHAVPLGTPVFIRE